MFNKKKWVDWPKKKIHSRSFLHFFDFFWSAFFFLKEKRGKDQKKEEKIRKKEEKIGRLTKVMKRFFFELIFLLNLSDEREKFKNPGLKNLFLSLSYLFLFFLIKKICILSLSYFFFFFFISFLKKKMQTKKKVKRAITKKKICKKKDKR